MGDFGLSKIKRNTLVTGGVRGTLPWMAPELLNGSSSKVSEKVRFYQSPCLSSIEHGTRNGINLSTAVNALLHYLCESLLPTPQNWKNI